MLLANGAFVEYDWLVLALGSDSVYFGIEGVKEFCLPFCTYEDAMRVSSCILLHMCTAEHTAAYMCGAFCNVTSSLSDF